MTYKVPVNSFEDWRGSNREDYVPTDRQREAADAVSMALSEGLFYSSDVIARCKSILRPDEESAAVNEDTFAMDMYYARQYVTERDRWTLLRTAFADIRPEPDLMVGTLVFNNDLKRNTGCRVIKTEDHYRLVVEGKRGKYVMTFYCDVLCLAYAMDQAASKGYRPDNAAAFSLTRKEFFR